MFWTMPPEPPEKLSSLELSNGARSLDPPKGPSKTIPSAKRRSSRRWGSAPVLTANLFVIVMVTYLAVLLSVRASLRPRSKRTPHLMT